MNFSHKSAVAKKFLALAALPLLGACGNDSALPHVFGDNEVPQEVRDAPRAVPSPSPDIAYEAPWPRLGDVPFKPADFTNPALIDETKKEMREDRNEGEDIQKSFDATQP